MNFLEAQQYLYSLGNEVETMKLGLDNITALLSMLKNPQRDYFKIQVAGTNGKGSVCAFLGSIYAAGGFRVGVYTSPHLETVTERILIAGDRIDESAFANYATQVRIAADELKSSGRLRSTSTFFEQLTAIALLAFSDAEIDVAVLETGLGGRFDATTAAEAEVAAITRIDLDHQQYLGNTVVEIAAEKAAIIRSDSIVVIGKQGPKAARVLSDKCLQLGIDPILAEEKDLLRFGFPPRKLGLAGDHQFENAQIAVAMADVTAGRFPLTDSQIGDALETAIHHGRLEWIGKFLLDGAHNPAGALALRRYVEKTHLTNVTLIFGVMEDKNFSSILEILSPIADQIVLTRAENSRSIDPTKLMRQLPTASKAVVCKSVSDAIEISRRITPSDGIILVTGSLYLVGEARNLLNN